MAEGRGAVASPEIVVLMELCVGLKKRCVNKMSTESNGVSVAMEKLGGSS